MHRSSSAVPNAIRRAVALAVPALLACSSGGTGSTDTGTGGPVCATTFSNPVAQGADPWVVRHEGRYYSVESTQGGIVVYRTDTLTKLERNAVRVWSPMPAASGAPNVSDIWAPELHFLDGKWYIYYAAGRPGPDGPDAAFTDQRAFVLESVTDDPQGAYVDKGMLYTGDTIATGGTPFWAIDMTVARIGGELYAVWSGWEALAPTHRTAQHTYIARMSNPWTIATNRVKISSPTESWEIEGDLPIQEGQEFLMHGDNVFIVYSAAQSYLPTYKLALLRLTQGADPLLAASWTKSGPVFTGRPELGVYGVGHASFTKSPDGAEDWIVYHAKSASAPGWDDRRIRMQKFGWNANGTPNFGAPVPGGQLAVPSGQCD